MFAARIIEWQRRHGRHDLPWQADRDPYRIWVSEIMLQQTQVAAVIPYFLRFVERFPDVASLGGAELEEVLQLWSGLGYYSRARNLHACAQRILTEYGGRFPGDARTLAGLPGIGRSTAAAIAAFAFGERAAILDGNVRRVMCRFFGVEGYPGLPAVERELWSIAERELPPDDIDPYTQGLMDLGATLCTRARPGCDRCPLAMDCVARLGDRVACLPAPRPRKTVPTRETTMLVLRRDGAVLLERRPPAGIWGGLWSLPEVDPNVSRRFAELPLPQGLRAESVQELPRFVHAFSHFRLQVQPLLVDVEAAGLADSAGRLWLALEDAQGAALPSPVKALLLGLPLRGAAGLPVPGTGA